MEEKEVVKIRMFGDFEITFRGVVYNLRSYLSNQLINLLQYLIINHNKEIFNEMLYDAIWSDNTNPQNSLKYTVHRLRDSLKKLFKDDNLEWIETKKGGYRLTDKYDFQIDTDQLTALVSELGNKVEFDEKDYKKAVKVMDIYVGHLYITSSQLMWSVQIAEWYCNEFANIVGRICKYLILEERYEEMIKLDYQAILREPFYEGLHYFYMQGLIKTREYHKALQYYDEINAAFYKELGVGLSPRFKELYNIIEEEREDQKVLQMVDIKEQLQQNMDKSKNDKNNSYGYYCTYDLFKYIYELLVKTSRRDHKIYYLILFSVVSKETIDKKVIVINQLRDIILTSTRSSDICAKVNDSQFVLLVPCEKLENTYLIVSRITNKFYKKFSSRRYRLNYNIEDIIDRGVISDS